MTRPAVRPHPLRPARPICQFSFFSSAYLCVSHNISWQFLFDTNEGFQETPIPPNLFKTNVGGKFYSIQINDRWSNPAPIPATLLAPPSSAPIARRFKLECAQVMAR